MVALNLSSNALLSLLQWCDSLFPSGVFAHSFGLESAVDAKKVKNGKDLSTWIRAKLIHQVFPCDLVLLEKTHQAGMTNNLELLQEVDATAYAMRIPRELREGGTMIASRLIQTAFELYRTSWTKSCKQLFLSGQLKGDPAVAFGIVAVAGNIPLQPAKLGYLYMLISAQVSAALRLLPMGQQEGQRIIHELLGWVEKHRLLNNEPDHSDKDVFSFMPASEIASMQHETSPVRLFQS